jgi:hypothetical protein
MNHWPQWGFMVLIALSFIGPLRKPRASDVIYHSTVQIVYWAPFVFFLYAGGFFK